MNRYAVIGVLIAWAAAGCGQHVEPIDLHDQTIPVEARRLVADAQDSIDIARAKLDEARRKRAKTVEWREEMLDREWPSQASSAKSKLRELANARVQLAELEVERAEENVEFARAKYRLITAKTAIRNDLAIYELQPLRRTVRQENKDVKKLDGEILSKREKIERLANSWWDSYARLATQGVKTRVFFVSEAGEPKTPDLRTSGGDEGNQEGGGGSEGGN